MQAVMRPTCAPTTQPIQPPTLAPMRAKKVLISISSTPAFGASCDHGGPGVGRTIGQSLREALSSAIGVRRSRALPLTTRSCDLARIERDLACPFLPLLLLAQECHRGLRIRAVHDHRLDERLPVEGVDLGSALLRQAALGSP